MTLRGWLGETRLTRRGRLNEAMTRRGWLGEVDSTRTTQRDDDSTRTTRPGKMCRRRLLDESRQGILEPSSQGCRQLKGTFVLRYFFFSIILNVKSLLKLWSFIPFLFGCFISLINPLFWILKFHFIFIYIIIIGIHSTNVIGGLISALTRWISL